MAKYKHLTCLKISEVANQAIIHLGNIAVLDKIIFGSDVPSLHVQLYNDSYVGSYNVLGYGSYPCSYNALVLNVDYTCTI